ncbi:MAG: trypsin-like peptidase domain-containing protein [Oligoflexia bacterium]|nr:trypsin-like peptidase domain-containing protein [Oligoflexia bacterium]
MSKFTKLFVLLTLFVVNNNIYASNGNNYSDGKVVYGDDNRVDFSAANPTYKLLSKSTAAMIEKTRLVSNDFGLTYTIVQGEEDLTKMLCEGERFKDQPTAALCSGFLVAPDIIITAGHCYMDKDQCNNSQWVFDYNDESLVTNDKGEKSYKIKSKDVYSCKEVIAQKLDPADSKTLMDYSVIRLDRKVEDRTPLTFRKEGKIADNADLVLIGYPSGLPLKIADSAKVRKNDSDNYFVANTDSFQGNSGSAVLDAKTGTIEGILVRGEADYDFDMEKFCYKVKKCESDDCRGEDVTRITVVSEIKEIK